jgi:hypothetical protein
MVNLRRRISKVRTVEALSILREEASDRSEKFTMARDFSLPPLSGLVCAGPSRMASELLWHTAKEGRHV